jgi:hypothetical protein
MKGPTRTLSRQASLWPACGSSASRWANNQDLWKCNFRGECLNLAAGLSIDEILRSYPSLSREAVQAAISYAAELARERVIAFPA